MKTTSSVLKNLLSESREFHSCDLYELTLRSGEFYRYADYDMNITAGGKMFPCSSRPIFKRSTIKCSNSIQVDKTTVTFYVDESDIVGGLPILMAAHSGMLDDGKLEISRCYMSAPGVVVGTISLFYGETYVTDGGGLGLKLDVKSSAQYFKSTFPHNRYYPTCPWTLYGVGCGLVQAQWATIGTAMSFIQYQLSTNLSFKKGYYDFGTVEWLTGLNTGTISSIKISENGIFSLLVKPEAAVVAGDSFRAYPGCDKSVDCCRDKFNNLAHTRATPFVPLKETLI